MRDKVEVVCAVKLAQKISAEWSKEDYVFLVCFPDDYKLELQKIQDYWK